VEEANELLRESVRAIKSSRGQPMLITACAVMTEAKRLARKAIKAQWQAQGRKVPWVEHSELVGAARAYLDLHRAELINQARANLSSDAHRRKP
jgi:hypothetical protein